ncbi:MAG TPA: hypothetical protein VH025_03680 [Solirubrobacteraceae bacterium]|jgi:hypothetical protein|nr:hypothetical protein [Solirubrobacteraceae bacterium]
MRRTITLSTLLLTLTAAILSGCGQSVTPKASVAAAAGPPRSAQPTGATGRLFSPESIWNRRVASAATVDPASTEIVHTLLDEVSEEERANTGPWINTTSYGVPIVTVPADEPTVRVALHHAPDAALSAAWSAVPLPPSAQPAAGSDGYMVVWQPSTDRMWEFWRLVHEGDGWSASWGGAMRDVSKSSGVFGPGAWPGAKPWWGASASSLPLAAGAMTISDLRSGRIDHALSIAVPDVRAGVLAAPAQRTDGNSDAPGSLPEGAHLRLDPHLDLRSLHLRPLVYEMALAAQRYGIVVRDFAGNIAFFGQDPSTIRGEPYKGEGGFYEGMTPAELLASFPWSHLQVLKMHLEPNP